MERKRETKYKRKDVKRVERKRERKNENRKRECVETSERVE